ncbi:MAG: sarcosine oxidase [Pseudomonadota bacterium]
MLANSPLMQWHQVAGAEFADHGIGQVVSRYENESVPALGIFDLSCCERIGFKGADTESWLKDQGVSLPSQPNMACKDGQFGTVLRLSQTEFWVLDNPAKSSSISSLREASIQAEREGVRTYLLERNHSHSWFCLSGQELPEMMSKVCAVDLRDHKFGSWQIAQTSVARLNAVVVREAHSGLPIFHILSDTTAAEFMWSSLLDAMQEFDGAPIGFQQFQQVIESAL